MTDDEGFLNDTGLRWFTMLALVASLAVVSYLGNADEARASRPTPSTTSIPSTTTTTVPVRSIIASSEEASTPPTAPVIAGAERAEGTASSIRPPASPPTSAPHRMTVESTVYCISGVTYSGGQTHPGVVAVNRDNGEWERLRGTRWRVVTGPHAGRTYTVEDAGPAAHFDMWAGDRPDCGGPRGYALARYGRKAITVERIA